MVGTDDSWRNRRGVTEGKRIAVERTDLQIKKAKISF